MNAVSAIKASLLNSITRDHLEEAHNKTITFYETVDVLLSELLVIERLLTELGTTTDENFTRYLNHFRKIPKNKQDTLVPAKELVDYDFTSLKQIASTIHVRLGQWLLAAVNLTGNTSYLKVLETDNMAINTGLNTLGRESARFKAVQSFTKIDEKKSHIKDVTEKYTAVKNLLVKVGEQLRDMNEHVDVLYENSPHDADLGAKQATARIVLSKTLVRVFKDLAEIDQKLL